MQKLRQIFSKHGALRGPEFDLVRDQETLYRNLSGFELVLQLLEKHPLMRRMLVDERHSLLRLGDDEGIVDLCEGVGSSENGDADAGEREV